MYASSHEAETLCSALRTLGSTACAPGITSHRYSFAVVLHILEIGEGTLELPAVDGLGGLAGVLEGDAQVGAAGARGFGGLEVCRCVADLISQLC
jgi:hypothetical protein